MNSYELITEFIIAFFETITMHICFITFLELKEEKNKQYFLSLFGYFLGCIFTATNNFSVYFVSMFAYSLFVILVIVNYKNNLTIKLIVCFMYLALNYGCTVISSTILWWNGSNPSVDNYPFTLKQTIVSEILLSSLLLCFILAIKTLKNMKDKYPKFFQWFYSFIVPLAIFIFTLRVFSFGPAANVAESYFVFEINVSVLLILSSLSLYFLADRDGTIDEIEQVQKYTDEMYSLQYNYYRQLDSQQREISRISHDMKNHLRYILNLIETGHKEEAIKYINEINNDVIMISKRLCNSGNSMIDAILNYKLFLAEENGIKVDCQAVLPPQININNIDLCIILTNLIDNAIEACDRINDSIMEKFISIEMNIKKGYFSIVIINTYNGEIKVKNNVLKSLKEETTFHGIGLSNVKQIIKKYDSYFNIDYTDTIFSVKVLISIDKNDGEQTQVNFHRQL